MKLVVLGANGRTGKLVVQSALARNFDVTAVVRSTEKAPVIQHERLRVVVGDPCDAHFLARTCRDQDALVSTLGGRLPTAAATSVYFKSAQALVKAASETGLNRVVVTSTALLFREQTLVGRVLRFVLPNVVRSAGQMEATLRASTLNWTSARVGFLSDAQDMKYRAEKGALPQNGTSISRSALAEFLVDAIEDTQTYRAVYGVSGAVTATEPLVVNQ